MELPEENQAWRKYARCKDISYKQADRLFFFGPGGSPVKAREFCAGCKVRRECLHFAIYHKEEGIWAGTTDEERRELREVMIGRIQELHLIEFEVRVGPETIRAIVTQAQFELMLNPNNSEDDPLGLAELLEGLDNPIVLPEVC